MTEIAGLKEQAAALRKQQNYAEAVTHYTILWDEHREECNEWDGWGYAFCLRKLERSQEALAVCQQTLPLNPNFDHLTSLYGWCLYDTEIKRTDAQIQQNEPRFLQAADKIFQLGAPSQYTAHARTLLKVIDYYKKKPSFPAAKIIDWCDKIQPDQLSDMPGSGPDGKGRTIEYASDREKWYACRCKALFDLKRYKECISVAEQALVEFPTLHHDNDIWFRWRIALSKAELGDKETAISELEALLSRKKDWFIHHKIAQYLFDLGRTDEALERAIEASLAPGPSDIGFKWELFLLMGRILQAQSEMDEARKHILLAVKARQEEGWKIPPELAQAVRDMNVDVTIQVSAYDLYRELRKTWQSRKVSTMPKSRGAIKNLLPSGKTGFICAEDGKDYHFRIDSFEGPRHLLQVGQKVRFCIEKSRDLDKRDSAVFVKPEKM